MPTILLIHMVSANDLAPIVPRAWANTMLISVNNFYTVIAIELLRWYTLHRCLTHWGRVTHICVGNLTIIGSDNGLSPVRRQTIIWTNAGIVLIEPLGTNFSEIWIGILSFSFKKMHLKMSSGKWRPSCPGLNVLNFVSLIFNATNIF